MSWVVRRKEQKKGWIKGEMASRPHAGQGAMGGGGCGEGCMREGGWR